MLRLSGPILRPEFASLMRGMAVPKCSERLGVCVSGGADSMALVSLLRDHYGPSKLKVYVVDHQLRPNSSEESLTIQEVLRLSNLDVQILKIDWKKSKLKSHPTKTQLESASREERYQLVTEACERDQISALFLGHHLNDQIETVLFRFTRASGVNGLGGMKTVADVPVKFNPWSKRLKLLRPLLEIPKQRLIDTCKHQKVQWIEDPSNADVHHQRNQIRAILRDLEKQAIENPKLQSFSLENLKGFCDRMDQYRRESEKQLRPLVKSHVLRDPPTGTAFLYLNPASRASDYFFTSPHLVNRLLSKLIVWVGGNSHSSRLQSLIRLRKNIIAHCIGAEKFTTQCLGGVLVVPPRPSRTGGVNWIFSRQPLPKPEAQRMATIVHIGYRSIFDSRFFVEVQPPDISAPDIVPTAKHVSTISKGYIPEDLSQWNMVLRFATEDDFPQLKAVLNRNTSSSNPMWYKFRRAIWHYTQKMPLQSRCTIPVIAIVPKEQPKKAVRPNQVGRSDESGAVQWSNDRIVAIPSLGINLIQHCARFDLEYKESLSMESEGDV